MFTCYQCRTKCKERQRVYEGMNLCGTCREANDREVAPYCVGYVWHKLPRYLTDEQQMPQPAGMWDLRSPFGRIGKR